MATETHTSAEAVRAHRFWDEDLEGLPLKHQIRALEVSERAAALPPASGSGVPSEEVFEMIDGFRQPSQTKQ